MAKYTSAGDVETWEQVHIFLHIPHGSDYLLLVVRAVENVYNKAMFPGSTGTMPALFSSR